jgi:hypothetical protein
VRMGEAVPKLEAVKVVQVANDQSAADFNAVPGATAGDKVDAAVAGNAICVVSEIKQSKPCLPLCMPWIPACEPRQTAVLLTAQFGKSWVSRLFGNRIRISGLDIVIHASSFSQQPPLEHPNRCSTGLACSRGAAANSKQSGNKLCWCMYVAWWVCL